MMQTHGSEGSLSSVTLLRRPECILNMCHPRDRSVSYFRRVTHNTFSSLLLTFAINSYTVHLKSKTTSFKIYYTSGQNVRITNSLKCQFSYSITGIEYFFVAVKQNIYLSLASKFSIFKFKTDD